MDELEYRRKLRDLPRSIDPERDLYPGIAARLEPRMPLHRPARGVFPFAAAAVFATLALAAAWLAIAPLSQRESGDVAQVAPSPSNWREAKAIEAEIALARDATARMQWQQYRARATPDLVAAWAVLDAAEAELANAIRQTPRATAMWRRMQQVQEQRQHVLQKVVSA